LEEPWCTVFTDLVESENWNLKVDYYIFKMFLQARSKHFYLNMNLDEHLHVTIYWEKDKASEDEIIGIVNRYRDMVTQHPQYRLRFLLGELNVDVAWIDCIFHHPV
jgi:hypothetical protein